MRRVTWMVRLHQCDQRDGFLKISWVPMQRTNYYMPWGVVTVDELSKMEYTERADWWNDPDYEYMDTE